MFLVFFVLLMCLSVCAVAEVDPVGWWKFDHGMGATAYDATTNNNHGSIEGDVSWVTGHIGAYALEFGGGRVEVPDAAELRPDIVTVCAWIHMSGPQGAYARVLEKGNDNHETYNLQGGGYEMTFMIRDNGDGAHSVGALTTLGPDEWIHIAGVYNGSDMIIYVNGERSNTSTVGSFTPYQSVGEVLDIGARPPDHDRPFNGMIDDVRVYDTDLSDGEIRMIYAGGADSNMADDPNPEDGTRDVQPFTTLSWTPGENAVSHDVYIGTDFDDVNDANTSVTLGVYRDNVEPNALPVGPLHLGATYYWRIDEVNEAELDSPWKGEVWTFTVDEGKARDPNPPDVFVSIPVDVNLAWTPGPIVDMQGLYFGTDFNDVNTATPSSSQYEGPLTPEVNTFDPGPLEEATTYYWRIDQVAAGNDIKGDVWRFTCEGSLHLRVDLGLPQCADGGAVVITDPPVEGTVKEGWWGFVVPAFADMYMHDAYWEMGEYGEGPPPDSDGIAGSGVHVALGCGGAGDGGFHVYNKCRAHQGGGGCPTGPVEGGAIANGWYHNIDWGGEGTGDILMRINGLPPGEYVLVSYHNHWEPCTSATRNCLNCESEMPNMPSVTAQSLPVDPLPGYTGWNFTPGTGMGVTPIEDAYDVDVTSVTSDDEVSTSTIRFHTDGSDVLVIYDGGDNEYPDPARPRREGSKGVLNAFELVLVAPDVSVCGLYSDDIVDRKDLREFVDNWLWSGLPGGFNAADFTRDGKVDSLDYAVFAAQWLESCP
jgi:hypothetical protein